MPTAPHTMRPASLQNGAKSSAAVARAFPFVVHAGLLAHGLLAFSKKRIFKYSRISLLLARWGSGRSGRARCSGGCSVWRTGWLDFLPFFHRSMLV